MELAQALHLLWRRKIWVALAVVVAIAAGLATVKLLKKQVYAVAATQMIVDSPRSPLGNTSASLDPFVARASVFADLMTNPPALAAIGEAAGIPGNEIVATGPSSAGQTPTSSAPAASTPVESSFKLFLDQDPTLPTVNIYAQAPTTSQAIALANGAITGFNRYLQSLEGQTSISANQRVEIRQLGKAVGGMVDPGANKKLAAVAFFLVLLLCCVVILLIERLRGGRPDLVRVPATPPDVSFLDEENHYGLPSEERPSRPVPDVRIDSQVENGRRVTEFDHHLVEDHDAALAEYSDRVAALAEPSSAPDEG
jgi:hypothetical protein